MRAALCILLLLGGVSMQAQVINPPPGSGVETDTTDWRGWSGASISFKPAKGWSIAFNQQWRWDERGSSFDRQLQQLGCAWSPRWNALSRAQSLGLAFRHVTRPDRKGDVQGNDRFLRWQAEHGAAFEAERWTFETRIRFQSQKAIEFKDGTDPTGAKAHKQWRFKSVVEYNIRGFKWDPEFSVERFVAVVPEGWQPDGAWRMRLATSTKLGKRHKLRVFIQRDWEARYNPAALDQTLIEIGADLDDLRLSGAVDWTLGVQWRYRLKLRKKKVTGGS